MLQSGQNVVYFGPGGLNREAVVARAVNGEDMGRVSVFFAGDRHETLVPVGSLSPLNPLPEPLKTLVHHGNYFDREKVAGELVRHRAGWRYILSQQEDDLCWIDFYRVAASLLPEGEAKLANLKTMPPKAVMMHNCDRFTSELLALTPEKYKTDSPEAIIEKQAQRIRELEAEVAELKRQAGSWGVLDL
jgi:hypothetical protein